MRLNFYNLIVGLGIIVLGGFLATVVTFAANWAPPSGGPPNNNVDAPLNVGPDTQEKVGDLLVEGFSATALLIDGPAVFTQGLDANNSRISGVAAPIDGLDAVNKDFLNEVLAQSLGGNSADNVTLYGTGTLLGPGANAPACPAAYPTEILAGYGPHWIGVYQHSGSMVSVDTNSTNFFAVASFGSDSVCSASKDTFVNTSTSATSPSQFLSVAQSFVPYLATACGSDGIGQMYCNSCRICSSIVP